MLAGRIGCRNLSYNVLEHIIIVLKFLLSCRSIDQLLFAGEELNERLSIGLYLMKDKICACSIPGGL